LFGCTCSGDAGEVQAVTGIQTPPEASECPSEPIAAERAPDVRPEHEDPEFWLAKLGPELADAPLLGADERDFLQERVAASPGSCASGSTGCEGGSAAASTSSSSPARSSGRPRGSRRRAASRRPTSTSSLARPSFGASPPARGCSPSPSIATSIATTAPRCT